MASDVIIISAGSRSVSFCCCFFLFLSKLPSPLVDIYCLPASGGVGRGKKKPENERERSALVYKMMAPAGKSVDISLHFLSLSLFLSRSLFLFLSKRRKNIRYESGFGPGNFISPPTMMIASLSAFYSSQQSRDSSLSLLSLFSPHRQM
jgi:hypothetical protein